jgi:HNH endonuclease
MTRDRVRELLEQEMTITEVATVLALSKSTICYHARRLGVPADDRFARRFDWAAIRREYERGRSVADCRRQFGFTRSAWDDAIRRGDITLRSEREELELYLRRDCRVSRGFVKRGLLRTGLKPAGCERCGTHEWRGRPLSLALHHMNGDGRDNRLENLQLLCPNCHSQTPNFSGRNVGMRRKDD